MVAAAVAVSALLVVSGWLGPPGRTRGAAPASCPVLQVENQTTHSSSIVRLTLPSGERRVLGSAGSSINALAYSAEQGVSYGVTDKAHVVRVDSSGRVTDLGSQRGAGVTGAVGGAMAANTWYVLRADNLYTVDADPASRAYLDVTGRVQLRPVVLSAGVDDIAYNPANGLLYGVSVTAAGHGSVVTINPRDGRVAAVPGLEFPLATSYGSVVFGLDGALYATANKIGRRSVTYRLPRNGAGPAVEISTGPELVSSDAAGCLAVAAPPPPPPSLPPPSLPPPPSPTPSRSSVIPAPSQVVAPPRQVAEQPPSVNPAPVSAPADPVAAPAAAAPPANFRPVPTAGPVADAGERVEKHRRWGLTALVLILGGGAAAAHVRRGR